MNALRQKLAIGVMGMVGLLASGMVSAADFSSWQKSMPVTFSGYNKAETLTNFPALVVLSTNIGGFSYTGFLSGTNADLRFMDASQTIELNYEIDTWNTNGSSYVWVQVPLLTTNAGIWAYWGSSGQTAPAYATNGATWSNGYISVHHLNGAGGVLGLKNSVANTNNLTNGGGAADTSAGVVGHSVWLNGGGASTDTNYLTVASNYKGFPAANQPFTLSLWVNMLQTNNSWRGIMGLVPTNTWVPAQVEIRDAGTVRFYVDSYTNVTYQGTTGADVPLYADANYSTGVWYYLSMPYDGAKEYFSVNGTMQNGGVGSNVVQNYWTNSLEFDIGRQGSSRSTCLTINALVDEPRVSAVARSANWIWAEWMNMASNSVFTTNGVVQQSNLPRIFNIGLQNLSNTSADVVGTLTTNGTSAATVYLYWSATDGMTNDSAWTTGGGSVSNLGVYSAGATFTNTLTGLAPNTTNYWNYSAVNSSGTVWAATAGSPWFRTYGPPGVNNSAGATDLYRALGATLNGNLTNGVAAHVYFLVGTQDGTWSLTNDLLTLNEGPFSKTVGGLNPATIYYYTSYATNAYGAAMATPSVCFTTRQGSAYYWVGTSNNAPWSSASSWATTSGGASGAGVPGAWDDVIFDAGGTSNALINAAFTGTVYSVTLTNGYSGTITQSNNLTVVRDFTMSTGAWQFVTDRPGALTVTNNMTISSATVYCQRISTGGNGTGRVITVDGNLTVASNGTISAFALGFGTGSGPGAGGGYGDRGASHGGRGAAYIYPPSSFIVANNTYGSVTMPTSLGSGADNNSGNSPLDYSPGGGAIKIVVGGTLRVDGTVTANAGLDTFVHNGGGGSGGSVWIIANDIAGAGTVSANGKAGGGIAASGGGGRIAVYTSNTFGNLSFRAYDGGNSSLYGAAGTIYLENTTLQASGKGTLIINSGNHQPVPGTATMIPVGQTWTFPTVILTNAAVLGVVSNTYTITNIDFRIDASNRNTAIWLDYGTLDVGPTFTYSNYIVNLVHASSLTATNITVGTNAVLRIDYPNTMTGDVTIAAGGMMDHRTTGWGELFKLDLALQGNLTIQPGGSINLTGKGYGSGGGPGAGGGYNGSGASYGGRGGKCIYAGFTNISLPTYGSVSAPANWGSGADGDASGASTGGGALKLNLTGKLTVNGPIVADGRNQSHNGGCGSGGSIYIFANDIAGTNQITTRGALSSWTSSSGGGGGRIAVYTSNTFGNVIFGAEGAPGDFGRGAAGTIYLKGPADTYGKLLISNSNLVTLADVTTRIPTNNFTGAGTNLDVGSVVLQNAGNLEVPTGMVLVVHSYWTNSAVFTAGTNSTVVLGDTIAAAVYGNTTFFNLTSTNLGKVLTFQAGRTNTVQGTLALANVTLKSTASGQYTYLTLSTNGGSQQIGAVTVQDNNAGGGQLLLAGPRSVNNGRNVNWKFPAGGTALLFR